MKYVLITLTLLFTTPASAWLVPQGGWNAAIARGDFNPSPEEAARLKCFQRAPWVAPPGYYQNCLAMAARSGQK